MNSDVGRVFCCEVEAGLVGGGWHVVCGIPVVNEGLIMCRVPM